MHNVHSYLSPTLHKTPISHLSTSCIFVFNIPSPISASHMQNGCGIIFWGMGNLQITIPMKKSDYFSLEALTANGSSVRYGAQ